MFRYLATIAATLAIVSGALLASDSAQAGASASAPSKYNNRANQVATAQQTNRHSNDFGITEYSSSSAKNAPRH